MLHSIEGYTSLIQLTDNDKKRKEYIDKIFKIISRGTSLAHQLLIFGGKSEKKREQVRLNKLIDTALSIVQETTPKTIEFDKQLDGELVIYADQYQLEQVIINLLMNAVEAVNKQGKISVKTKIIRLDDSKRNRWNLGGDFCVKIQVDDDGIGIPLEIQNHIFEPFFTTKKGKGTGLGLSTVYSIVTEHKGHIECISKEGKGTSFKIYLPLNQSEDLEDKTAEANKNIKKDISGITILIVDDELNVLDVLDTALKNMGCEVVSASKGSDAIRIYQKNIEK